jgi:hypothetical protein
METPIDAEKISIHFTLSELEKGPWFVLNETHDHDYLHDFCKEWIANCKLPQNVALVSLKYTEGCLCNPHSGNES